MGLGNETEYPEPWPTQQWSTDAVPTTPLPLKERIRLAKEHMGRNGQRYDTLWPYQRFALNIGELLDAAERGTSLR